MPYALSISRLFYCLTSVLGMVVYPQCVQAETVVEIDRIVIEAPRDNESKVSGHELIKVTSQVPVQSTAADVVSQLAGVHVLRYGGLEQATSISIRGSGSSQVTVFFDGVPLTNASQEGITLGLINAGDLSRIEVYRSFAPAEYGAQAIGGVVSLASKNILPGHHAQVGVAGGSFGTLQTTSAWQRGGKKNDMALGFNYRRTGGDFTFSDNNGTPLNPADDRKTRRQNNAQQIVQPHFRWQHRFSDGMRLNVSQHFFRVDHGVPGLENFQSRTANRSLSEWLGQFTLSQIEKKTDHFSWKNTVYHRLFKSQFSDPNGEIGLGAGQDNDNLTLVFGDRISGKFFPCKIFSLVPQAEYVFEYFSPRDYLAASPTGSASRRQQINFSLEPHTSFFSGRFHLDGLFWSGHAFYNINNDDPSLAAAGTFFSGKIEHPLTATMAVRYKIWDNLFIKGSASRTVRLPQFNELFGDQGYVLGNPQLSSEKSIKFDAGLSWQKDFAFWLRQWRWEIAYFENHVDNLIQFELANGLARANNLGKARIRGVEAVSKLKLFDFLELSQNYTWQLPRDLVSGVNGKLVGRPEHEANFVAGFKKGPFFVSTNLNYIDKQYLDRLNTQVVRHRSRWDAHVSYKFRKKINLGLDAKNILGTQIVDAVGFPLPGRSFMGNVEVRF